jgi:hypothetical protein
VSLVSVGESFPICAHRTFRISIRGWKTLTKTHDTHPKLLERPGEACRRPFSARAVVDVRRGFVRACQYLIDHYYSSTFSHTGACAKPIKSCPAGSSHCPRARFTRQDFPLFEESPQFYRREIYFSCYLKRKKMNVKHPSNARIQRILSTIPVLFSCFLSAATQFRDEGAR